MTTTDAFHPQLISVLRAAPWRTIERRFLFILAASIALHIVFAGYIAAQPMPVTETFDDVPERAVGRVTLPPLLKLPKSLPPAAAASRAASRAPAAKPADARATAKEAVAKLLGVDKPGGAFGTLIDSDTGDIASALEGATNFRVAGDAPTGPRGPTTGALATVERLGTDGAKQVILGSREDKIPATATPGVIGLDETDGIDPRALQQFITARRAGVQNCFERELHHNPSMKGGKITVRLFIGTTGRASGVTIDEDTLGSEAVSACMRTLMGRWIFPFSPKDEVPVSVPFVFARAI